MKSKLLQQQPIFTQNFTQFLSSGIASTLGDAIYLIVLAWYITQIYGSGTLMGSVLLTVGITRIFFMLMGGVVADRWRPKQLMILSSILRALLVSILGIIVFYTTVPVWVLLGIAFLFGMIDAFYWPAGGVIRQSVSKGRLVQRNSINFTSSQLMNILGPALGGYLLTVSSFTISFGVTVLLFLLSGLMISLVSVENASSLSPREKKVPFIAQFKEGIRYIKEEKWLLTLLITLCFINIGVNGAMMTIPFLVAELGLEAGSFGSINASLSVGAFLAGIFFSIRSLKSLSFFPLYLSFFGQGLFLIPIFWLTNFWWIVGTFLLVGVFTGMIGVILPSIMQQGIPAEYMGRAGSVSTLISMGSTPIAQFLFGILTDSIGPRVLFLFGGCLEVMAAIIAYIYLRLFISEQKIAHQEAS